MKNKRVLDTPKYGWCSVRIGDIVFTASYLTDLPTDILEAFVEYIDKGKMPVIIMDGEDNGEAIMTFSEHEIHLAGIPDDGEDYDVGIEEVNIKDAILEITKEIEEDINEWSMFYFLEEEKVEEQRKNKHKMVRMIEYIKENI